MIYFTMAFSMSHVPPFATFFRSMPSASLNVVAFFDDWIETIHTYFGLLKNLF